MFAKYNSFILIPSVHKYLTISGNDVKYFKHFHNHLSKSCYIILSNFIIIDQQNLLHI